MPRNKPFFFFRCFLKKIRVLLQPVTSHCLNADNFKPFHLALKKSENYFPRFPRKSLLKKKKKECHNSLLNLETLWLWTNGLAGTDGFFSKQAWEEWFACFIDTGLHLLIFTTFLLNFSSCLFLLQLGRETANSPSRTNILALLFSRVVHGWECYVLLKVPCFLHLGSLEEKAQNTFN